MRYPTPHEVIESLSVTKEWEGWTLMSCVQWGELSMYDFSITYRKDNVEISMVSRIQRGSGTAPWLMLDRKVTRVRTDVNDDRLPNILDIYANVYGQDTADIMMFMRRFPDAHIVFLDNEMDDDEQVFGWLASNDQGVVLGYLPLRNLSTDPDDFNWRTGFITNEPAYMYRISVEESARIVERINAR